jgi:CHAT domain-containing protein
LFKQGNMNSSRLGRVWAPIIGGVWLWFLLSLVAFAQGTMQDAARLDAQMRAAFDQGKYADALTAAQQQVAIWEKLRGPNAGEVVNVLLWQGQIEGYLGKPVAAEKTYQRALQIQTARFGANHPELSSSLSGLASIAFDQGKYFEAEKLYRQIVTIQEKLPGANLQNLARNLDNLGSVNQMLGRLDEGENATRRALALFARLFGTNHPDYALCLNNLAVIEHRRGKFAEARELYSKVITNYEKNYGASHPLLAPVLCNAARLCNDAQAYDEAEELERDALAIVQKSYPPEHPEITKSLNNLSVYLSNQLRYAEAEKLIREVLARMEKTEPVSQPDLAAAQQNLAVVLQSQGKYAEAKTLYEKILPLTEKSLGPEHPDVGLVLDNYALALASLEEWPAARKLVERERRLSRHHVAQVLANLNAEQQLFYLKITHNNRQNTALALGLREQPTGEGVNLAAGWLLNGKGLTQEALTQNALLLRAQTKPEVATLAKALVEVRQQLARLAVGHAEQAADKLQHEQLAAREEQLLEQLAKHPGTRAQPPRWIELDEVRRALPAEGVLIEFACFDGMNFAAKDRTAARQPKRYAAWIIPAAGQGEVRVVDLGFAEPIDRAVQTLQQTLKKAPELLNEKGEPESEKALQPELQALADLVLKPLLPYVGKNRQWVLSPDAALWLVPWAALPTAEGKYVIEGHELQYVISGRELVRQAEAKSQGAPQLGQNLSTPVMFADPMFDLEPAIAAAETKRVLRRDLAQLALRAPTRSLGNVTWDPLPGTALEAAAVQPNLAKYSSEEPIVYSQKFALEGVVKSIVRPRVAVFSTHGFFLPEQPTTSDRLGLNQSSPATAATTDGQAVENPLLRCGLVFAGANRRKSLPDLDDGVLTGLEIVGLDLRGTEFVVLSACETGLGQINAGEGVAGLRQAFQLAGAQSVLATLWQIPDRESALLINEFFANLAGGQLKADALRQAQLKRIAARRAKTGAAHPLYWAAWTLTGE